MLTICLAPQEVSPREGRDLCLFDTVSVVPGSCTYVGLAHPPGSLCCPTPGQVNWGTKGPASPGSGFITIRPQRPLPWPNPSPLWPGPHVAVVAQQVVGQHELVKGHNLAHALCALGRRVGVEVHAARRGRVRLARHQPGRAMEGIPGDRARWRGRPDCSSRHLICCPHPEPRLTGHLCYCPCTGPVGT